MTMLEKIGVVVIVVAVIIVVGMMSWSLLRPSKVPPRPERALEWKTAVEMQDDVNEANFQGLFYAAALGLPRFTIVRPLAVENGSQYPLPAFRWPHREPLEDVDGPVRTAFRRFLEGGPNYYRQGG